MLLKLIVACCASLVLIAGQATATPAAAAVQVNEWQHFVVTERSLCTGENVTFESRVHFVLILTETPSGITITASFLTSVSGIAISESGGKYLLRDGSTSKSTGFVSGDAAETFTATIRLRLIRLGERTPNDDLYFRANFHLTATPAGDVVVQFENISDWECR